MNSSVIRLTNAPKLARRTVNARIAIGTNATNIWRGVVQMTASLAATNPPSTVPPMRSNARRNVSAKNG
jgi:hypothetical protein